MMIFCLVHVYQPGVYNWTILCVKDVAQLLKCLASTHETLGLVCRTWTWCNPSTGEVEAGRPGKFNTILGHTIPCWKGKKSYSFSRALSIWWPHIPMARAWEAKRWGSTLLLLFWLFSLSDLPWHYLKRREYIKTVEIQFIHKKVELSNWPSLHVTLPTWKQSSAVREKSCLGLYKSMMDEPVTLWKTPRAKPFTLSMYTSCSRIRALAAPSRSSKAGRSCSTFS